MKRRIGLGVLAVLLVAFAALYLFAPASLYRLSIAVERWRGGVAEHQVKVDGLRWSYLAGGEGPTLLLLHGFSADKDNWTRISPWLTDHFRVIAPDLVGFGDSATPTDISYAISAQAQRVLAFAEAIDEPQFHLVGSSMGGYIAVAMAAKAPERVRSLSLLAPGGVQGAEDSPMFESIAAGRNPLIPETPADFADTLDIVFEQPPFIPGPIRDYLARQLVARQALLEQIFADLQYRSEPIQAFGRNLSIPTLIIWGEKDRVLHPSGGRILHQAIPRARVVMLPDIGHLPMIETPQQTAEILRAWLAGQEG